MKMLMKIQLPVEPFNQRVKDGTAGQIIGRIMETTKPETAYFTAENGCRGGTLVINVDDPSQIPFFAEPWFLQFNAKIQFLPFMTPEDLAKAGLDKLGQEWS